MARQGPWVTSVNRDKRKVPVIGWGNYDNRRGRFPLPFAERHDSRIVLPLGRSVVGCPNPETSPTLTIAPITASCDLIRNSCLNHPFRSCQAPYLTTIAGERLLNVTTTVTSTDFWKRVWHMPEYFTARRSARVPDGGNRGRAFQSPF